MGFTLIELMITVAIVGILAAVAYPSYQEYVKESNRTTALTDMQKILDAEERYFLQNFSYTASLDDNDDSDGNAGLGLSTSSYQLDDFTISARKCREGNTDSGDEINLTICVELLATADEKQKTNGSVIINSTGRFDICPDNDFDNCESITN